MTDTDKTTRQLVRDLNAIIEPQAQQQALPAAEPRDPVPGVGIGRRLGGAAAGGGGSIASPLTEPDASTRTYHQERAVASSDGVFVLMLRPIKTIDLLDANQAPVRVEYGNPP